MVCPAQSSTNGILYPIALPNYIDQEPLKLIRIQYSWFGLPSQGADAFAQAILPSPGGAVQLVNSTPPTNISGNIYHRWDDYRIIPNPDSERFEVVFVNADPRWVIFDTISVPEPTSLALLGFAGLLVGCGRRR
ncbi:MAG: PEP-CTERM sorting domain-containing protein [Lacipirellulaceae bacterium]